jgi:hypothetical protein
MARKERGRNAYTLITWAGPGRPGRARRCRERHDRSHFVEGLTFLEGYPSVNDD